MLLTAEGLCKNYGIKPLLDNVTLHVDTGVRIGLIGVNGAGKSTLLKVLSGVAEPDEGRVARDPNVQVAYLPQTPEMDESLTVLEQVFAGHPPEFRVLNEYEAKDILTRLGIVDFHQKIAHLSGGQRKRVALATVFVHPADVLILDEPTNHLDADMVTWLEQRLSRFTGGLVMVTHDRYFLENVVTRIAELSRGRLVLYESSYSGYLNQKAQRLEIERASERKRQALLRRETEWIMRGARARSTKSVERIARYEALKAQEAPEAEGSVSVAAIASRLGRKTVELKHVSKSYDGKTVIRDFSYTLLRDDRVGVIGRNGSGKSTLMNLIAGTLPPDSGTVDYGGTVRIGYFAQENRELDPLKRPYDYIHEIACEVNTREGRLSATQMLERFLFTSEMQFTTIGKLSGGERRRLYLLGILISAPNILLLDEPTNDLDVETLTILEEYLTEFPGAIVAVSHDRYFLDKVADSILEVRGDGQVLRSMGGYTDWVHQQSARKPVESPGAAAPQKASASKARRSDPSRKLKFSFREQREYETIDEDINALEQKIADCDQQIEQSSSDYLRLQTLLADKDALQAQLDEKTDRWIYLNDLAERIALQEQQKNTPPV
ncbi:MAG: ABC-F family ATP-binding cassette domain-containing protein [Christensenellales bacterium]|nr:ABC-F family ATP-binding cassette domain-containing protein [Christensenellales bacterium]